MADDPAASLALNAFVKRLDDLTLREGLLDVKWHTLGLKLSVRVSPPPAPWYDVALPEPEGLEVEADRVEGIGVLAWLNEPGRRTSRVPRWQDSGRTDIRGAGFDYVFADEPAQPDDDRWWDEVAANPEPRAAVRRAEEDRRRAAVERLRARIGPLNDHVVTIRRAEASRIAIPVPPYDPTPQPSTLIRSPRPWYAVQLGDFDWGAHIIVASVEDEP